MAYCSVTLLHWKLWWYYYYYLCWYWFSGVDIIIIIIIMSPPKKMTRNKASTSDRISNLPTEIIENILLRLPLRDTVKTCVLSKSWNEKWKTVPQIVFDESFCTQYPRSYNMRETLFNCMDGIVHIHKKPITKFALSIPILERFCPVYLLLDRLHKDTLQDFTLWISKGVVLVLFLYKCFAT